jgi:hypothetical protein
MMVIILVLIYIEDAIRWPTISYEKERKAWQKNQISLHPHKGSSIRHWIISDMMKECMNSSRSRSEY